MNKLKTINYQDLVEFIVKHKSFKMDLPIYIIEKGFRKKWNASSGELVGDGQFKNFVYSEIEKAINNQTIQKHIPQQDVDACVDLLLKHMSSIGEYKSDFSEN